MLRALHSNSRCLQSHRLETGLYATILIIHSMNTGPVVLISYQFSSNSQRIAACVFREWKIAVSIIEFTKSEAPPELRTSLPILISVTFGLLYSNSKRGT
jgi:hypothetical protein